MTSTIRTDRDALLAGILECPGDDLRRLAFADFLEDAEPYSRQAEFIRVQCEYAERDRTGVGAAECSWGGTCCCRSHDLRREEVRLWRSVGESFDVCGLESRLEWESGIDRENGIAVVRRGFVGEVRCTLAAFLGGPCGRCDGRGGTHYGPTGVSRTTCPACDGTGRTPGIAAALFAAHPVMSVSLTDREPLRYQDGGGVEDWMWVETPPSDPLFAGGRTAPQLLPHAIFRHLDGNLNNPSPRSRAKRYATETDARSAASVALVTHARALAGLPPLPA